nr:hypothetical protein [uncultured Sphingomonas sp.]
MIEFEPPIRDLKLLRRAVRKAQKDRDPFPSLSDLAPNRDLDELIEIAKSWQRAGLGSVIEQFSNGVSSVSFTVDEAALELIRAEDRRSLIGRLRTVPRSDWIALAALTVSGLSAYFTYLTIRSH